MGGLEYFASVESVGVDGQNNEAELALQQTRRIDERLPRSGAMRLAPLDAAQGEQVAVQASNYSRGGLQVVSAKPFAEELVVRVVSDDIECHGVIRHCTRAPAGFLVGIELVEPPVIDAG